MGRQSSTGSSFLIERPDSHKFSYHRKLPAELRALVIGAITLPWKARIIELDSPETIKISLSTGDKATAQGRRDIVHVQIEDLIERARARLNADNRTKLARQVSSLTSDEIRHMAGQTRHDVLADHDRTLIDPAHRVPLHDVLLSLLRNGGKTVASHDAMRVAQKFEHRKARGDLARDIALFDQAIEEGEIDASPELIAKLLAYGGTEDPHNLGLSDEDLAVLCRRPEAVHTIPSPVDAVLAENGLDLAPGGLDRRALALATLRAKADAYRIVLARQSGDTTETPARPALIEVAPRGPLLSEVRETWIDAMAPGRKAQDDNLLYLHAFISLFGDIPVTAMTRKMVRDFRDLLKKRPRNMPNQIRDLPLRDQVAWGEGRDDCRKLTPNTVNAKGIGSLSAIMEAAKREDLIETNPCDGQLLRVKGNAVDRLPYSLDDLNAIFASPIYADDERWTAGCGAAAFWFPLLGLFMGARLEEIGQLLVADIRRQGHIYYFDIVEIDEAAEAAGDESADKKINTPASRRQVPIHPVLIELGFLRYLAMMKALGHKYLFAELKAYRGRRTTNWSKFWGRYTDCYVTKSARKVFHSFRHTFLDRLRNITRNDEAGAALAGHKKHMYGQTIDLQTRYDIICRLDYPGLDLSVVTAAAARLFQV